MFALRRFRFFALPALAACLFPAPAAAQDEGWTLDPYARVEVGAVTAKSATEDDEYISNGDGLLFRGQIGVELGDENTVIAVEADRIAVERGNGRRDTNRDRFTASIEQELDDDWEVRLRVRHYDDFVSAEFGDVDSVDVSARVTYEPERAHRFRLEATWSDREYDDGDGPAGASSHGDGPQLDAEYRHRLGRYHYVTVNTGIESIDSDNPDRSYSRQSFRASYTRPITRDFRVRPAIYVRHTRFSGRIVPGDKVRNDTYIAPELEFHYWPDNWRIEAEAKYIFANSNDPVRDREGYRAVLTVGYVF